VTARCTVQSAPKNVHHSPHSTIFSDTAQPEPQKYHGPRVSTNYSRKTSRPHHLRRPQTNRIHRAERMGSRFRTTTITAALVHKRHVDVWRQPNEKSRLSVATTRYSGAHSPRRTKEQRYYTISCERASQIVAEGSSFGRQLCSDNINASDDFQLSDYSALSFRPDHRGSGLLHTGHHGKVAEYRPAAPPPTGL